MYPVAPVVITENSEFELETGQLLSEEEVILDAMDEEGVEELKDKIADIKSELDSVLSSYPRRHRKQDFCREIAADKQYRAGTGESVRQLGLVPRFPRRRTETALP